MKTKILILTSVRLDGQDKEPGEKTELDESLLNKWIELGYCEVLREDDKKLSDDESKKDNPPKLKHLGGGYYDMPDGSKVHGKEAALEALKTFDA